MGDSMMLISRGVEDNLEVIIKDNKEWLGT